MSNMAKSSYLEGTLELKESTVHGCRSSFRDWASEITGHNQEVIEQSLVHKLANQMEAAYQRGDYLEKHRALWLIGLGITSTYLLISRSINTEQFSAANENNINLQALNHELITNFERSVLNLFF